MNTIGTPDTIALDGGRIVVHRYEIIGTGQTVHAVYVRESGNLLDRDADGGRYSTHTHFSAPDGSVARYGELVSYFPEERFAHLPAGPERSTVVHAYWDGLAQQAIGYIHRAYPYTVGVAPDKYCPGEIVMPTAEIPTTEVRP